VLAERLAGIDSVAIEQPGGGSPAERRVVSHDGRPAPRSPR
jgi:hypothetical protein